jgi:ABC-2 type transport system ATP-binding protein
MVFGMPNSQGEAPAIRVENISKRFGDTIALAELSFSVDRGELVAILGPNGAGKTTIVNILSTLIGADEGNASVNGHEVASEPKAVRESISLTGQFAAVDEMLTGRENLVFFGRLRGLASKAAQARADDLLASFSLDDAAGRRVGEYSGGMRRRLDLAASLVATTPVLFLDEPTTGLDPRSRAELWDVVRKLHSDGVTIVLTTQYLEEADQLADRVVVIDQKVIADGSPDELKDRMGGQRCVIAPVNANRLDEIVQHVDHLGEVSIDRELAEVSLANANADVLAAAALALRSAEITLADLSLRRPTLDDVFLELTSGAST